jgi:uncharacterized delta-60 repeat protein
MSRKGVIMKVSTFPSRSVRWSVVACTSVLLLMLSAFPAAAAAGDLDPTFGTGGIVLTNPGDFGWSTQIVIQPDGKIVAAGKDGGSSDSKFAVLRYNTDGSLDTTFGAAGTGIVIMDFVDKSEARGITLQPDGKIVAVGYEGADYAVIRLNADGTLDSTFGTGGIVTTDIEGQDSARSAIVRSDGTILVSGWSTSQTNGQDFSIVRYTANGSLDTRFGAGTGKVFTDFGGDDQSRAMVLQKDSKIVVGGYSKIGTGESATFQFALIRYFQAGRVDTSYGPNGDGEVLTDLNSGLPANVIRAMVIQPDGKVVVGGYVSTGGGLPRTTRSLDPDIEAPPGLPGELAIARYNVNGTLDATFGATGPGWTITDFGGSDHGRGLAMTADLKFVLAGNTSNVRGTNNSFAVARYNNNGSLDTTFGTGGMVSTDLGGTGDGARDVKIDANGNYVAAGISGGNTGFLIGLARYLSS